MPEHPNLVISVTGTGASRPFSALITDAVPNLDLQEKNQVFPLWHYEAADEGQLPIEGEAEDGFVRRDAITDATRDRFEKHYADGGITKEDVFYYAYGLFHSPEYRQRFAADLKKMLPRIPMAPDFWAFSKAGRDLARWHLGYESVDPFPLEGLKTDGATARPHLPDRFSANCVRTKRGNSCAWGSHVIGEALAVSSDSYWSSACCLRCRCCRRRPRTSHTTPRTWIPRPPLRRPLKPASRLL
jgi:hypothetical protein